MTTIQGEYTKNDPVYLGNQKQYDEPKEAFKQVVNLIKTANGLSPLSLIDIGCASGAFIHYAKSQLNICDCAGMDISDAHLHQAMKQMPDVEFVLDSITDPKHDFSRQFEVGVCLGTMSIFDDMHTVLVNLLNLVKSGGRLYIWDIVNDYPVDVIMRYRHVQDGSDAEWQTGFNVRSKLTYESSILKINPEMKWEWTDFRMPFEIPQTSNPMRAWTISTENNPHQIVVGTGQLLTLKILEIVKT